MVWTNDDGLRVRFGNELGKPALSGVPRDNAGSIQNMEIILDTQNDDFPAFGTPAFVSEPLSAIPDGAIILGARLIVLEAFTSAGAPTLDAGLKEQDGTEIDHNGLFSAIALASLATVGAVVAGAGALINTALAANGYAAVNVNVADYTAGKALIQVEYVLPQA